MNQLAPEESRNGVKSIRRLLVILKTLNQHNGSKVLELSRQTGISRQSIYRMLATLEEFGYVRRQETDDRYYLTHLVRELADGYSRKGGYGNRRAILEDLLAEVVGRRTRHFLTDAMILGKHAHTARSPSTGSPSARACRC